MLSHHIQQTIVSKLVSTDSLTFSALKDPLIDNKLFTYHLKLTIQEGFVEKLDDGTYRLTNQGRKLWKRVKESPSDVSKRALSVLYLAAHHSAHGWLFYRRITHPLKDRVGFMHVTPHYDYSAVVLAEQEFTRKTGLSGKFSIVGSGFFRVFDNDQLESYVNFTLLYCDSAHGTLHASDTFAEYFWVKDIASPHPDLLPNMPYLISALEQGSFPFFLDQKIEIASGG